MLQQLTKLQVSPITRSNQTSNLTFTVSRTSCGGSTTRLELVSSGANTLRAARVTA